MVGGRKKRKKRETEKKMGLVVSSMKTFLVWSSNEGLTQRKNEPAINKDCCDKRDNLPVILIIIIMTMIIKTIIIKIMMMIIIIIITIISPGLDPRDHEILGWCRARDSLISWGGRTSLALVGNPSRDGASMKIMIWRH